MKLYMFPRVKDKSKNAFGTSQWEDEDAEIFELNDDDRYAIELAKKTIRHFLMLPGITPREIIGIGNVLYSLERMPLRTPGMDSEFSLYIKLGNETLYEMENIAFRISDSDFELNIRRYFSKSIGSNTFDGPGYYFATDGYREKDCDLSFIEEKIEEFINRGAELYILDGSKIEYEESNRE